MGVVSMWGLCSSMVIPSAGVCTVSFTPFFPAIAPERFDGHAVVAGLPLDAQNECRVRWWLFLRGVGMWVWTAADEITQKSTDGRDDDGDKEQQQRDAKSFWGYSTVHDQISL